MAPAFGPGPRPWAHPAEGLREAEGGSSGAMGAVPARHALARRRALLFLPQVCGRVCASARAWLLAAGVSSRGAMLDALCPGGYHKCVQAAFGIE